MTKKELVRAISEESGLTQSLVKEIVQKTFDSILNELEKGNRVELRKFGVFEVKTRSERRARNVSTGEIVIVPERKVVVFRASKEMEKRVAESGGDQRFSESGFMPNHKRELENPGSLEDNGNGDRSTP